MAAAEDALTTEARAICRANSLSQSHTHRRHIPRLLAVVPSPDGDPLTTSTSHHACNARSLIFPVYQKCLYEQLQDLKAAHMNAHPHAHVPGPVLPLKDRLLILLHIVRALMCAQHAGIAHCDVKPANIMFDATGAAVLIDWGLATPLGEYFQGAFGTAAYVPPEMLDPAGFLAHSSLDIWSLGVVCLEMAVPHRLNAGLRQDDIYALLQAGELYGDTLAALARAPESLGCEQVWATVILRCLQYEVKRRTTLQQLESFALHHLGALAPHPTAPSACPSLLPTSPATQHQLAPAPGSVVGHCCDAGDCDATDSTLAGSFLNRCQGVPREEASTDVAAEPQPTAAALAASTLAVLRLASVNSCAAFDLLRSDAGSAAASEAVTPGSSAALPACDVASGAACGDARTQLHLGLHNRGASTPASLDAIVPLISTCELESFDRFTDRGRRVPVPIPTPLPRGDSWQPSHATSGPLAAAPSPPGSPPSMAWIHQRGDGPLQGWCPPSDIAASSRAQLPCAIPDSVAGPLCAEACVPSSAPPGVREDDLVVLSVFEHRHPFGRSPPQPGLPFRLVSSFADAPDNVGVDPTCTPDAAAAEESAGQPVLHVQLPRVRTARGDTTGQGCSLPDVDELITAAKSPTDAASGCTGSAAGSGRSLRMSFGKFEAYTPASACTSPAALPGGNILETHAQSLAGVHEETPTACVHSTEDGQPGQHQSFRVESAARDVMLFRMDDDEEDFSHGSSGRRGGLLGSPPSCGDVAAIPSVGPWLRVPPAEVSDAGQKEHACAGDDDASTTCGTDDGHGAAQRRRRRTWGCVSLHAAHCSVQSDLPDTLLGMAPDCPGCSPGKDSLGSTRRR